MPQEHTPQTPQEARFDRVYARIISALSQAGAVEVPVGGDLWDHPRVARGQLSGPLIKSRQGIPDPDLAGVTWDAWWFWRVIIVRSNRMAPGQFADLLDIQHAGMEFPGAWPGIPPQ